MVPFIRHSHPLFNLFYFIFNFFYFATHKQHYKVLIKEGKKKKE